MAIRAGVAILVFEAVRMATLVQWGCFGLGVAVLVRCLLCGRFCAQAAGLFTV